MRLSEYVQSRLLEPKNGLIRRAGLLLWGLWALLVKPAVFRVRGQSEAIELGIEGGMWRVALAGFLMVFAGLGMMLAGAAGTLIILILVLASPIWLPVLFLIAAAQAWSNVRRYNRMLAKARAGITTKA